MTPDEYVQQVILTESEPAIASRRLQKNDHLMRLLHGAVGMSTESGEFMDQLKRVIFYGKDLDAVNLQEELGDMLWYIALAVDALNMELATRGQHTLCRGLSDIMVQNISKLRTRYPNNFTEFDALNRNTTTERTVLESHDRDGATSTR